MWGVRSQLNKAVVALFEASLSVRFGIRRWTLFWRDKWRLHPAMWWVMTSHVRAHMTSLPPVSIAGVDDDQPNIHRNTHEHKWILVLQQQQCFLDSPQIAASSHDYGTCQCMPYGHYDSWKKMRKYGEPLH